MVREVSTFVEAKTKVSKEDQVIYMLSSLFIFNFIVFFMCRNLLPFGSYIRLGRAVSEEGSGVEIGYG